MIGGQTTNVDAASGATYSSNGIITAVRNALSKAETGKSSTKKKKKKNKKIRKRTVVPITIIIIIKHRQKAMKTAPIPEARPVRESSLRNIV